MITNKEMKRRFGYAPTNGKKQQVVDLSMFFIQLAEAIVDTLPEGREQSLALTELEKAQFWANAALLRKKEC